MKTFVGLFCFLCLLLVFSTSLVSLSAAKLKSKQLAPFDGVEDNSTLTRRVPYRALLLFADKPGGSLGLGLATVLFILGATWTTFPGRRPLVGMSCLFVTTTIAAWIGMRLWIYAKFLGV